MGKSVTSKLSRIQEPVAPAGKGIGTKARTVTARSGLPLSALPQLSSIELVEQSRRGVSFELFEELSRLLSFTISEWAQILQLSERTLQRQQKDQKTFSAPQSERLLELSLLIHFGTQVFGDTARLLQWLNLPCRALENRKPKELLDSRFGIVLIQEELGRIEHGILA